jgi:hypothetical protein
MDVSQTACVKMATDPGSGSQVYIVKYPFGRLVFANISSKWKTIQRNYNN